jgi:hypothetical protein
MITVLSFLYQNHHKKQYNRKHLFEVLKLILKISETKPHCNYLNSYIKSALECFIFRKSRLTHNIIIDIINKNKLKNVLTFISQRDYYGIECVTELIDLYYQI